MDKQTSALKRSLALILMILISSSLFLFLNRYDNKYTHNVPQAINGALYVSEKDWTSTPTRYLRDGWRFYSDTLLTPKTLRQQGDDYQYISIGGESNFAMGDLRRNPHGSASYAMTLYLPEQEHTYGIELPEIYSAYRLYVNERLKLQMGEPEKNTYRDRTQCRMITFEASGKVTLLLAVSDYSWVYSGLIYPPAFGEPLSLNTSRGLRIFLCLIMVTVTLMLAILTLYLALRAKGRSGNTWLFFLLCLATSVFTSYSVIHAILPLPIQPWYSIELCSGYLVTLFVILIHNRICDTKYHMRLISGVAMGAVSALAFLYGIFAAYLTLPVMLAYSYLFFGAKLFTVIYLLLISADAVRRNIEKASLLLYADIVYACAFAWDRLLPDYEPILGGWFQEWGSLSLVIAMGVVLWYDVALGYQNSLVYAEEQRHIKRQLTMQVEHLRQMNLKVDESSKLRHDFRHHLRTLISLCEEGRNDELGKYIRGITEISEGARLDRLTDNVELDALLQYYINLAQSSGISVRTRLLLPEKLGLPIVDLCGLLGNLLENAIEACQRQMTCDKRIFIAAQLQNNQLEFVIDNSFEGELRTRSGRYLSSKRNDFGIGISSVLKTVERYEGNINMYADCEGFHTEVSLPLRANKRPSATGL